jgi:hypothetical protein
MADEPITTAGTPKAVRDLELEAMSRYRAKYPEGIPWQELDHSTRCVWVTFTEIERGTAGVDVGRHETFSQGGKR